MNKHTHTQNLKIEKPYITLNEEMYITLHTQEQKMCKKIGYEYYCEELFIIKSKSRYSCASTIYFNLESDVIRANCEFQYYYNKTDIKPTVLDGGFQIILANWPNYMKIMCLHNNNIPINILGHPYVSMNQSILCNGDIEAESNFLLESLATGEGSETFLDCETMHFASKFSHLVNYFHGLIENVSSIPIYHDRLDVLGNKCIPLSLETFEISPNLINAIKTLQDLVL